MAPVEQAGDAALGPMAVVVTPLWGVPGAAGSSPPPPVRPSCHPPRRCRRGPTPRWAFPS